MTKPVLTIDKRVQRRFILGKQGLYPGRRWKGIDGAAQAIQQDCVVQIDPLSIIARSPDIALYSRVLDYSTGDLDSLLYEEHLAFEYGQMLRVYPVEDFPFFEPLMKRKLESTYWSGIAQEHDGQINTVRKAIQERGPLGPRDLDGRLLREAGYQNYRAGKDSGMALYFLWLVGELVIHSRRRNERVYDLRERLLHPSDRRKVSIEEAEAHFARKAFRMLNLSSLTEFRGCLQTIIERPVKQGEAKERIEDLLETGWLAAVELEGQKLPRYLPAEDLDLLEEVQAERIPAEWTPLDTTTGEEMVFLAPLEVAIARGRALPLFEFEYVWEVYKPAAQRRWGYYTLPILHEDRLVARFDSKLDRKKDQLEVRGFWLEDHVQPDQAFLHALSAGFSRFLAFLGAGGLQLPPGMLTGLNGAAGES